MCQCKKGEVKNNPVILKDLNPETLECLDCWWVVCRNVSAACLATYLRLYPSLLQSHSCLNCCSLSQTTVSSKALNIMFAWLTFISASVALISWKVVECFLWVHIEANMSPFICVCSFSFIKIFLYPLRIGDNIGPCKFPQATVSSHKEHSSLPLPSSSWPLNLLVLLIVHITSCMYFLINAF